jgi:hypothetical protein
VIAHDSQHTGDVLASQPGAQRPVIPGCLVGGHPGERCPCADGGLRKGEKERPPTPTRAGLVSTTDGPQRLSRKITMYGWNT